MELNACGLILSLLAVFLGIGLGFLSPFIQKLTPDTLGVKKLLKKDKSNKPKFDKQYFLWLGLGSVLFIYLFIFRFMNDFKNVTLEFITQNYSSLSNISKGMLLDFCPMCAFLICVLMIADYKRIVISYVAYIGYFGGLITLFGGISFVGSEDTVNAAWDAQWIFKGYNPNPMYYMMHAILVIVCPVVALNARIRKTFWWEALYTAAFATVYYLYVFMIASIFHVQRNVSGVLAGDWDVEFGEYGGVSYVLNLTYPWVAIVSLIIATTFIFWMVVLNFFLNKLVERKRFKISKTFNL